MGTIMFQSTRPRGRTRLLMYISVCHQEGFNPRVLAGGRDLHMPSAPHRLVFQSTRPRGRTRLDGVELFRFDYCFNPRVLAGGRDF